MDNAGNVLVRLTQDLNIDAPLSMLQSGIISYFERDGLGSVTSLSNSAGALANAYTYDSFGKLAASTGTIANHFQYTGREYDPEIGIYQYRARYYDQNIGRFISEDPIRFRGGINFYRYAGNNAINRSDPDGMGAAECLKALEEWALAYANVQRRLGLLNRYGDMEAGHAQALEEALDRLQNATEKVKRNCTCNLKAEAAAVAAATAALEARVAEAIIEFCAEEPAVCEAAAF